VSRPWLTGLSAQPAASATRARVSRSTLPLASATYTRNLAASLNARVTQSPKHKTERVLYGRRRTGGAAAARRHLQTDHNAFGRATSVSTPEYTDDIAVPPRDPD